MFCALVVGSDHPFCCGAVKNTEGAVEPAPKPEELRQLFSALFARWDRNQDGRLDSKEINAVIGDPAVRGRESVIAVLLQRQLRADKEAEANGISRERLLALADAPQTQQTIARGVRQIGAINRAAFLPGDPDLSLFHQGRMGDCYLLSAVGAFAYHHPQQVRRMIRALPGGYFEIRFTKGRNVVVAPVTDAELLMGAREGADHGIWLSILEKAYAEVRKGNIAQKTGQEPDADETDVKDLIGHGGRSDPVIELLTGHKCERVPLGIWFQQNPGTGIAKAHGLLAKLSNERRLMTVGTSGDKTQVLPKGLIHGHGFAVLEYNAAGRKARLFNPWGNHFEPGGEPGMVNGYPTDHGVFDVPLRDFLRVFRRVAHETGKGVER